jgi:isopenicillin N synthase-like dioxygenase
VHLLDQVPEPTGVLSNIQPQLQNTYNVSGAGYLPYQNRKLPTRDKGNLNEAFIVKADDKIDLHNHNPWPNEQTLPGFRRTVESYSQAMSDLGHKLLPLFATALDMPCDYFQEAFVKPTFRLRMTHYPPADDVKKSDDYSDSFFGIAPHVDTSFCTILAQDNPGLVIFSEERKAWIRAPLVPHSFIVNGGELLRHWTNDRFLSVKHFANNNNNDDSSNSSRYSIPFFFNANQHHLMQPIPTCVSDSNPMKYPVISYSQSQAIAQGE